jgi:transposase
MEFGITVPVGPNALRRRLPEILEDGDNELPMMARDLLATLAEQLRDLDDRIEALEHQIESLASQQRSQPPPG